MSTKFSEWKHNNFNSAFRSEYKKNRKLKVNGVPAATL